MASFKVAILGCGTVGGGVARILLDEREVLQQRAGRPIELTKIVDLFPRTSAERHGIPLEHFCGGGKDMTPEQAGKHTRAILDDPEVDLVVETIGGSKPHMLQLVTEVLSARKHLVTANKALLATHGKEIFDAAGEHGRAVGFEAAVCGAIPIIKAINECFTGDRIESISGIFNGTSNFILSKMEQEGQSFQDALKDAQQRGYAEADPSLDINGGDAGHKLVILLKLAYGLDVTLQDLDPHGIEQTTTDDMVFAHEMDGTLKLICFARRDGDEVFATVRPMIVKRDNLLSSVHGATNAVRMVNTYSDENVLIGQGAGSFETGSAIVSDLIFIARHGDSAIRKLSSGNCTFRAFGDLTFPYSIVFHTTDEAGITGLVATAIGEQSINIDTVSHNRHTSQDAVFAIATMPCTFAQIERAIAAIRKQRPTALLAEPKITPVLAG